MLDAFREGGGEGKPVLQVHVSWAPTDDEALAIAHDQWRTNVFAPPVCWDMETVEALRRGGPVRASRGRARAVLGRRRPGRIAAWLAEAALGFDEVNLHHVGQEQGPSSRPSAATCCPDSR